MPNPTNPKIAMFHELRSINSAAYAISLRAKGTPFETRAKQIAKVSGSMLHEYQSDPDAMIDNLDDHGLNPMMLLIGHIVAMEF